MKLYRFPVLLILGAFVLLGLVAPSFVTPRFKVTSVISISPSYFQNSLMREFLSEVYDASELRSQRQSLISQSLDQAGLDAISEKVGLITSDETPLDAAQRRQNLLNSIEVFPLQSSDFQISVISKSREQGLQINQAVLANVLSVLQSKRMQGLQKLRSAIAVQLDSMAPLDELTASAQKNLVSPAAIQIKLNQLQKDVEQRRLTFASAHPVLQAKERELKKLQRIYEDATQEAQEGESIGNEGKQYKAMSLASENSVYNDLRRKYSFLNIVIHADTGPNPSYFSVVRSPELPPSPIWPKRSLFFIWSVLLGIFTAVAYVALKEFVFPNETSRLHLSELKPARASLGNHEFVEPSTAPRDRPQSHDTHL